MRIVHLTPELPYWPGGSGGATRQFHLLRRLVELGHSVTVVAPVTPEQRARAGELAEAGIVLKAAPRPASRVGETLRALTREPVLAPAAAIRPVLAWQTSIFWTALRPIARAEVAENRPDVITVEHDSAAHWIADMPADVPAALVLQNIGPRYYESRAHAAAGPASMAYRLEARRFALHHTRWLRRYRALIAVSEREARELRFAFHVPVETVPNGVATTELLPLGPSEHAPTLLFTGTLDHPPNAEGIRWFADEVFPRVRAARHETRLLIVGRSPTRQVLALDDRPGVEVVGAVPAMSPYFARATAVVAPLLSGGGTRLKILEAFASSRAVVSTSVGCEGLDVTDGRELLVADDPQAFADATLQLLDDDSSREAFAGAGRRLAEQSYDWRVLGERLADVLERVSEGRTLD
jgi:polysaccharide biosynthesis protein PslH